MARALRRFFGWIWSGLDGLRKVLHLILLLVLFGALWAVFSRPIPLVPDRAALVIAPQGPIVEQDVLRIAHSDSPDDLVRYGKDIEKTVLARGLRYHLEDRVLAHGNKTVVFR